MYYFKGSFYLKTESKRRAKGNNRVALKLSQRKIKSKNEKKRSPFFFRHSQFNVNFKEGQILHNNLSGGQGP